MPRLPRDCSGQKLARALESFGYHVVRQRGSHIRLHSDKYDHSITIPDHDAIRVGTLNSILNDVTTRTGVTRQSLIDAL